MLLLKMGTLSGYRPTWWLSFPVYAFFSSWSVTCKNTFPLHNHLVATSPHALHLLYSPTARKNSCLVGAGTTRVTKPAISRLPSMIQSLSCACSISNEHQNKRFFFFFLDSTHCVSITRVGSVTLSPFVSLCYNT